METSESFDDKKAGQLLVEASKALRALEDDDCSKEEIAEILTKILKAYVGGVSRVLVEILILSLVDHYNECERKVKLDVPLLLTQFRELAEASDIARGVEKADLKHPTHTHTAMKYCAAFVWPLMGSSKPSPKVLLKTCNVAAEKGDSDLIPEINLIWEENILPLKAAPVVIPAWKLDLQAKKKKQHNNSNGGDGGGGSGGSDLRSTSCSLNTMTPPPPPPPLPPPPPQPESEHFIVDDDNEAVTFPMNTGNAIHLAFVVTKYTGGAARPRSGEHGKSVTAAMRMLYNCLGLFKSLQFDLKLFNSAVHEASDLQSNDNLETNLRVQSQKYRIKRLSQQLSELGVKPPESLFEPMGCAGLDELVLFVERKNTGIIQEATDLIMGGAANFDSLGRLFVAGTEVVDSGLITGISGQTTGMLVRASFYREGKTMFGKIVREFHVALEFVVSAGTSLAVIEYSHTIPDFQGTVNVSSLDFKLVERMTAGEDTKQALATRGHLYSDMSTAPRYMGYSRGCFIAGRSFGTLKHQSLASGRVMVDTLAAYREGHTVAKTSGLASGAINEALKQANSARRAKSDQGTPDEILLLSGALPPELVWRTWPTVTGFSFTEKGWGQVIVDGISEIEFNSDVFNQLVLPQDRKELIEALVVHSDDVIGADLISGKGEGTIFLLHGPPGVGKTLTAEAIAELLKRPLYAVSMGELGVTPQEVDARLTSIFNLCAPWRALVLIDEAEMLLERRMVNDITRNAIVCVMLRLIEYYQGILFLTSNRVNNLDPAFQSRVTCALRYDHLDFTSRKRVWYSVLDSVLKANPTLLSVAGDSDDNASTTSNNDNNNNNDPTITTMTTKPTTMTTTIPTTMTITIITWTTITSSTITIIATTTTKQQ
eukprot:m.192468 g.192468  ORF g.192468 m.192468 type:complete len:883 (+) comp32468_c1_seq3:168-2816(+)